MEDVRKRRKKLEREISVQAFDYVHLAFSKYHNHQVYACIRLNGHIAEKKLTEALNLSVIDLPQLACHFRRGRYEETKTQLKVQVIGTSSAAKQMKQVMAESLQIEKSPQVRVTVLREAQEDTLVVVMSHLLCDGMALKQYIYLLCGYYNDLMEGRKSRHPFAGKERGLEWVRQCTLPVKGKRCIRPRKERLLFSGGDMPCFAQCEIKQDSYPMIEYYLKKNEITMNDLMMAVYYKTVWKVFRYPLKSLCCVMNLRRYMEDAADIGLCNQTGNAFTTIPHAERMPFEILVREVHGQMMKEKEEGYCLKQIQLLESVFLKFPHDLSRRLIRAGISNPHVAITNLGIVDAKRVSFHGLKTIECFLTPSLKKAPNFQLAVSTYQENIMLEVNMMVSKSEQEGITEFLREFREILLAAVSKKDGI